MRVGGKHARDEKSRVRDKFASVEAFLAMLDHDALLLREDTSVLVFDWNNCDSVEHESRRDSFRNTLLDDMSDDRSSVDSLSWDGARARVRRSLRRNTTDTGHSTVDMAESAAHRAGQGVRRVSLLLWPPEIIARDVPSASADSRLYDRGISVAVMSPDGHRCPGYEP